jgi:hypothetical protein
MKFFYILNDLVIITIFGVIPSHANGVRAITKQGQTTAAEAHSNQPLIPGREKRSAEKKNYEIVETRYPVPLPYCGRNCRPKWKPSKTHPLYLLWAIGIGSQSNIAFQITRLYNEVSNIKNAQSTIP